MKVAFDTSVLVAGSVARHVHEERARVWFRAAREGRFEAITTTHALAETWVALTAIPVEPQQPPNASSTGWYGTLSPSRSGGTITGRRCSAVVSVAYARAQCTMPCTSSPPRGTRQTCSLPSTHDTSFPWQPTTDLASSPRPIRRVSSMAEPPRDGTVYLVCSVRCPERPHRA